MSAQKPNVLITGAGGLVGTKVLQAMSKQRDRFGKIVALDIHKTNIGNQIGDIEYVVGDICDPDIKTLFRQYAITSVVHLAAIVSPGNDSSRDMEYRVDVLGSRNIIEASIAAKVQQVICLSSGAAYGYHASNPVPLREGDTLRGNEEFAYAHHKRLVEEMLAEYRRTAPQLSQLILRPGTILGPRVHSPVSAVFEGPVVVGISGSDIPFVMILVDDVAAIIVKGILERKSGIYNLAGDGALPLCEVARRIGKPYLPLPAGVLKFILKVLKALKLSTRGPEGVDFLRYRPVLANDALKSEFGFQPTMTTAEVFECYRKSEAST